MFEARGLAVMVKMVVEYVSATAHLGQMGAQLSERAWIRGLCDGVKFHSITGGEDDTLCDQAARAKFGKNFGSTCNAPVPGSTSIFIIQPWMPSG